MLVPRIYPIHILLIQLMLVPLIHSTLVPLIQQAFILSFDPIFVLLIHRAQHQLVNPIWFLLSYRVIVRQVHQVKVILSIIWITLIHPFRLPARHPVPGPLICKYRSLWTYLGNGAIVEVRCQIIEHQNMHHRNTVPLFLSQIRMGL